MCSTSVQTADHNFPSQEVITNLRRLCGWLENLRSRLNQDPTPSLPRGGSQVSAGKSDTPIYINSGYRSPAVNKAVGGVATSNHLTGCAADIRCTGLEQAIRYAAYLLDISKERGEAFDEILIEHRAKTGNYWVHFAVRPNNNRKKVKIINL
ncbi:MAG: hypothetical protein II523_00795 [Bacteroidales bacterium]|nr:hypothetical protein [Bacteroidales bacterium]